MSAVLSVCREDVCKRVVQRCGGKAVKQLTLQSQYKALLQRFDQHGIDPGFVGDRKAKDDYDNEN